MQISLSTIPSNLRLPGSYTEFDGSNARSRQAGKPQRICVLGPKLATGTAAANVPVQVQSIAQAQFLFGTGSVLAHMAEAVSKTNSRVEAIFCPQVDDAAAVARVLTGDYKTAYTAPAAIDGIERLYIDDRSYRVPVVISDTAQIVATKIAAAVNAFADALFTAAANNGVVTLTAKNKGLPSNDVQVVTHYEDDDVSPSGKFTNFTQTTAGLQNPDIAASLASLQAEYITHVVHPYTDDVNYRYLLAEATDRWSALPNATSLGAGQMDFVVIDAFRGDESQIAAHLSDRNSEYFATTAVEPPVTIDGVQYAGLLSASWKYAAAFAAKSAEIVAIAPNANHGNRLLNCIKPAPKVSRYPFNVRSRIAENYGGSTYKYDASGGQVLLETAITQRTVTDTGAPTDAEYRLETQFAKSYLRWSLNGMLELQFPNARLADDGTAGLPSDVVTPSVIKGAILSLAKGTWIPNGVVENFERLKTEIVVERSTADCNTVLFSVPPDIVNLLVVKAGKINYRIC